MTLEVNTQGMKSMEVGVLEPGWHIGVLVIENPRQTRCAQAGKWNECRRGSLRQGGVRRMNLFDITIRFEKKPFRRRRVFPLLTTFLIALIALQACAPAAVEAGILEGTVSIGPLVPVVRAGQATPTTSPEVYAAREIVVYEEDGQTVFVRLQIGADGTYRAELPIGTYVIDINRVGIDTASGLPTEIEIKIGEPTRLDIDIDTGIR